MSRLTHLRMGTVVSVFMLGLLWMPVDVSAAPGGPEAYAGKACAELHKIAKGENLTWIAKEHGVSLGALIEANNIKNADIIVEGQTLCIPDGGHDGHDHNGDDHGDVHNGRGYNGADHNGYEDWGSYGIPGRAYDPSIYKNHDNGYGPEKNGADLKKDGDGPQNKGYGKAYDPNGKDYDSKDYDSKGYDSKGYDKQEDWQRNNYGVPGKAYDPNQDYKKQHEVKKEKHDKEPEFPPGNFANDPPSVDDLPGDTVEPENNEEVE